MAIAQLRPGNPNDLPVAKFEIENEDVFHLKNLYKRIYEWLDDEGFVSVDVGDDKIERFYLDRTLLNGNKEHHIWWRTVMEPRDNKYYRYFLKVNYQTLNVKKMEIMHKGQKFGTNTGDVIIRVESWLQMDYPNETESWDKNSFLKIFKTWFNKRVYKEKIDTYKTDLYRTTYRLHTAIKQYLQLKMTDDWGRPFHPEKGV